MKRIFKILFQNIKSWGWYEWTKYLLASVMSLFVVFIIVGMFVATLSDPEISFVACVFFLPFIVLPILAVAWLIIKDYRLPYILLIIFGIFCTYWSLQGLGVYHDNYPGFLDLIDFIFMIVSVVCICKITLDKDIRKRKDQSSLSNISIIVACGYIVLLFMGMVISKYMPDDDDWKFERAKECIETRVAKGYPRDFAREYCLGPGEYCDRTYSKDCDPEIYCCFATIEEDKKWNYLDYDNKGNKVEKKQ